MATTPKIQLVAFEGRAPGFIFVAVPDERGRYLRTDRSVALIACPVCMAVRGEPCKGKQGYGGSTHHRRRSAVPYGSKPEDVIEPVALEPEDVLQLIEPRPL